MKSLFVVYKKEGKSVTRIYFRANNIFALINSISFSTYNIVQIKRLKRIYRKTDFIVEV